MTGVNYREPPESSAFNRLARVAHYYDPAPGRSAPHSNLSRLLCSLSCSEFIIAPPGRERVYIECDGHDAGRIRRVRRFFQELPRLQAQTAPP